MLCRCFLFELTKTAMEKISCGEICVRLQMSLIPSGVIDARLQLSFLLEPSQTFLLPVFFVTFFHHTTANTTTTTHYITYQHTPTHTPSHNNTQLHTTGSNRWLLRFFGDSFWSSSCGRQPWLLTAQRGVGGNDASEVTGCTSACPYAWPLLRQCTTAVANASWPLLKSLSLFSA